MDGQVTDTHNQSTLTRAIYRILYSARGGETMQLLSYRDCKTVNSSDHVPVIATFKVLVKNSVEGKKQGVTIGVAESQVCGMF